MYVPFEMKFPWKLQLLFQQTKNVSVCSLKDFLKSLNKDFVLNTGTVGYLDQIYSLSPEKRTIPAWHNDRNDRTAKRHVREMEGFKRKNIKVSRGLSKSIFFLENCNYSRVQISSWLSAGGFKGFFSLPFLTAPPADIRATVVTPSS